MNRFQDILILKYVLHCLSYIYHVYDPLMPTVASELESNLHVHYVPSCAIYPCC